MMSKTEYEIPEHLLCPITQELMTDPVIAADGQTYDRKSITEWLSRGKRNSPLTGVNLPHTVLLQNVFARITISENQKRIPQHMQ